MLFTGVCLPVPERVVPSIPVPTKRVTSSDSIVVAETCGVEVVGSLEVGRCDEAIDRVIMRRTVLVQMQVGVE